MQQKRSAFVTESNFVNGKSVTTDQAPRPNQSSNALSAVSSHMKSRSQSSLLSEPHTHAPISSRESMTEDCDRHRFAMWTGVEHNSASRMAASERLRFPLQEGHPEYPLMTYSYEEEFLPDLNKTLSWNYPMLPIAQQPVNPENVTDFGSSLDLTTLHSVTSSTQKVIGSPNQLPMMSDVSETPSESYAVSPAPLSDAPPEIAASHSYRPTPTYTDQGERNETLGPSALGSSKQKVEASEHCEICGYRPKGDPQWFKGSMAKHKKMQHSTNPPIIYKCPFPGCNSEYKNRRDNLRQHQIEKSHFVGDEAQRPPKRKRKEHV